MQRYFLCATPQYLKKHGMIDHPDQLAQHHFGIFGMGAATQIIEFTRGDRQFKMTIEGRFQSNQLDLIAKMVLASCCIAVLPEFMVAAEIAKGQLIPCLVNYRLLAKPLYMIYPQKDLIPLKLKVLIDLLKIYFVQSIFQLQTSE